MKFIYGKDRFYGELAAVLLVYIYCWKVNIESGWLEWCDVDSLYVCRGVISTGTIVRRRMLLTVPTAK